MFGRPFIRTGLISALSVLAVSTSSSAQPANNHVFLVDTFGRPSTREYVSGFEETCSRCSAISYNDARGDRKRLETIAAKARSSAPSLTIAIGAPAVEELSRVNPKSPIVSVLAPSAPNTRQSNPKLNWAMPVEPGLAASIQIAKSIVNPDDKIAIITASDLPEISGYCEGQCRRIVVSEPNLLPRALQYAYTQADFVILLKNSKLINRRSAEYIVKTAIESNIPTMAFSKSLVASGLTMAVAPDLHKQGVHAAEIYEKSIRGETLPTLAPLEGFRIHVNCNTFSRIRKSPGKNLCALNELEVKPFGVIEITHQ